MTEGVSRPPNRIMTRVLVNGRKRISRMAPFRLSQKTAMSGVRHWRGWGTDNRRVHNLR